MYNDITGIILCGGKSIRMGRNKAFLRLGDKFVIEVISNLMKQLFDRVMLITNDINNYEFLNLETYGDMYIGKGPLGGIHSGLTHSNTEKNFIISCDIPLITKDAIRFIADYPSEKKIIVPYDEGFIQQMCGVYSKCCLGVIEEIIEQPDSKKCKVLELVERAGGDIIDISNIMSGYTQNMFLNMNDISNYHKVVELYTE